MFHFYWKLWQCDLEKDMSLLLILQSLTVQYWDAYHCHVPPRTSTSIYVNCESLPCKMQILVSLCLKVDLQRKSSNANLSVLLPKSNWLKPPGLNRVIWERDWALSHKTCEDSGGTRTETLLGLSAYNHSSAVSNLPPGFLFWFTGFLETVGFPLNFPYPLLQD